MAFVEVPGLPGKVYVPENSSGAPRKHDCPDCYACQLCADDRCGLCLARDPRCCPPREAPVENG